MDISDNKWSSYIVAVSGSVLFFSHYLLGGFGLSSGDAQRVCLVIFSTFAIFLGASNLRSVFFLPVGVAASLLVDGTVGGVKQLSYLALLAGVVVFSSQVLLLRRHVLQVIFLLYLFSFVLFLVGWLAYGFNGMSLSFGDAFPWFGHVRYFNHFQTATLLFLPLGAVIGRVYSRLFSMVGGALAFALLFVSQGRGAAVSLLIGFVVILLFVKDRQFLFRYSFNLVVMIGFGLLIYLIFNAGSAQFGVDLIGRDLAVDNRSAIWQAASISIMERPWSGWGAYSYAFSDFQSWMPAHPHQAFLLIAFEWGVPVAIGILIVAVGAIFIMAKRVVEIGDISLSLAFAAFIALCVHAQVSSVLTMPVGQLMFALLLGQLLSATKLMSSLPVKNYYFSFFGFAIGVWVLVCSSYITYSGSSDDDWNRVHLNDRIQPRTWNNAS